MGFWKKLACVLKRLQGKVCKDEDTLMKAAMCTLQAVFQLCILHWVQSPRRCQLAAPPLLLDITTKWKIKPVKKNIFIQKIRKMHVLSIVGILSCNVFIDVQTSILLVYVGLKVEIES